MKDPQIKKAEAQERNKAYQELSLDEKISKAQSAPGKSQRQLKKLMKLKTA